MPYSTNLSQGGVTNSVSAVGPFSSIFGSRIPVHGLHSSPNDQGKAVSSAGQLGASVVDGGTARHLKRTNITWGISDLAIVYQNYYNTGSGEKFDTGTLTIANVKVEYPAGTSYAITFGGNTSVTVIPGQTVVSDPLSIVIPANSQYYIREYVTVPAPGQVSTGFPIGAGFGTDPLGVVNSGIGNNYFKNNGTGADDTGTSGTAWITSNNTYCFGPVAVIGTPFGGFSARRPIVGIVGDSVVWGVNNPEGSHMQLALWGASIPLYSCAQQAESAYVFSLPQNRQMRMPFLAQCSTIIFSLGSNDFDGINSHGSNNTFAGTLGYYTAALQAAGSYGAQVWVSTLYCKTTSTDSWATTINQTPHATNSNGYNTQRQLMNTYIRNPIGNGITAAAAGTTTGISLAYDCIALGVNFAGYIDVAAAMETDINNTPPVYGSVIANADRWYISGSSLGGTIASSNHPTPDGSHPYQGEYKVLSAFAVTPLVNYFA